MPMLRLATTNTAVSMTTIFEGFTDYALEASDVLSESAGLSGKPGSGKSTKRDRERVESLISIEAKKLVLHMTCHQS